jgi:surfactin synthase thioesterase subunit
VRRAPQLTLICLPHAGARATVYRAWADAMPWLRLCAIDYPGHGALFGEPLATSIEQLVASVRCQLKLGERIAIFGHSMGALVGYELCHLFEQEGRRPDLLMVSGSAAPSRRFSARFAAIESDQALTAELRRLGGTPPEVLADPELMELALPALRADFQACANYRWTERAPLHTPLRVLGGTDDVVGHDELQAWRKHTRADCTTHMFAGGHFFLHQNPECLRRVAAMLRPDARNAATCWA